MWAVKWSFVGLFVTAALQVIVMALSGSVALLITLAGRCSSLSSSAR